MGSRRRSYSKEFKLQAVAMTNEKDGKTIAEVADDLRFLRLCGGLSLFSFYLTQKRPLQLPHQPGAEEFFFAHRGYQDSV